MSLLRLLSAGKSLVGLKDSTPQYRMGDPRAMPKFGSAANPFRQKKEKDISAVSSEPKSSKPVAAPPSPAATPMPAKTIAAVASAKAGWRARLLSLWPKRRPKQTRVAPLSRPAIQGELSLDRVKVMRNDLSDADLEIVAVARGATKPAAGLLPAPEIPHATPKQLVEAVKA
jgi:hypothetical protein